MRVLDVFKGTGTGVAEDTRRPVHYELLVLEEPLHGEGPTPVQGWVLPTFGVFGEMVILEMQDGTSVVFEFLDSDGGVLVKEIVPCRRKDGV